MPASDVAPLPRLGDVFFDVRGNSRTMRLSWYADTGVAVFSIWQGSTCTATFRVPIADLPRLAEALQRGPQGAPAAGSEVPGTGSRSIHRYAQGDRGRGTYDAGGYQTARHEHGAAAVSADPLSATTFGDEYAARGRHAVPGAAEGPGGSGYPDPLAEPSPARTAAPVDGPYSGYPDVGGYGSATGADAHAGYAAAAYDGYPDPDVFIRQAEPLAAAGYPSPAGYPDAAGPGGREAYGGDRSRGGYGERAQHGSHAGYHNDDAAMGYSAADSAGDTGYPRSDSGSHGGYAGGSAYAGYPQPARYPESAGNALAPAPLEHTALVPPDPGPPTAGMPSANAESGRPGPSTADSPAPYPPDPYLDGPLPLAERASAEPRSPGGQRHAAADPWRAEDGPMSSRYGYPPTVDH